MIRAKITEWKQRALDAEEKLQQLDKEEDIFAPFPSVSNPAPAPVNVATNFQETVTAEIHHPPSKYGPPIVSPISDNISDKNDKTNDHPTPQSHQNLDKIIVE